MVASKPKPMSDYTYDIFISYRRHREWTPWTREHLHCLLDAYLTQELGRSPSIFIDDRIEPGADWPCRLAGALGRARILLAVFSRDYFGSEWCVHELDLMHERLHDNPGSQLIIPVIGHDGDLIPEEIARIQSYNLSAFRNTDLQRRTPRYEQFSDSIKDLVPHIATAIDSAPPFDDAWLTKCQTRFDHVYKAHCEGTHLSVVKVKTFTRKSMPFPTIPPRVAL